MESSLNKEDNIEVFILGAGQQVGRSCVVVRLFEKRIMFDCGLHMLYTDNRKYPDFSLLYDGQPSSKKINDNLDLVLITHFHLDHCGALPVLTEIHGYQGPIYTSAPTKALLPYMLEDFRRVMVDTSQKEKDKEKKNMNNMQVQLNSNNPSKRNQNPLSSSATKENQKEETLSSSSGINSSSNTPQLQATIIYTEDQIKQCCGAVKTIQLLETIEIDGIKLQSYYAGHVLGACMFYVQYKGASVLYTGDFNSYSDRHLGAASVDQIKPDLVISESTYATVIRDSKGAREREFFKVVQETIDNGGKVLIPVFALGRAQELSILLNTYWERTQNTAPVYFAAGLIEKANFYYKLFTSWSNEKIQTTFLKENMFDFKHIRPFDKQLTQSTMPMVLLATPGMLHGGLSMQVFKDWCEDERNTLIIPGYCVPGTLGNQLLSGTKNLSIDGKNYDVRMKIQNTSFSAHADAKGILNLIRHCEPKNVMLVHGDKEKMFVLSEIIKKQFSVPCFTPPNFQKTFIPVFSKKFLKILHTENFFNDDQEGEPQTQQFKRQGSEDSISEKQADTYQQKGKNGVLFRINNEKILLLEQDFQNQINMIFQLLGDEYRLFSHNFVEGFVVELQPNILQQFENTPKIRRMDEIVLHLQEVTLKVLEGLVKNNLELMNFMQSVQFTSKQSQENQIFIDIINPYDSDCVKKADLIFELVSQYISNMTA